MKYLSILAIILLIFGGCEETQSIENTDPSIIGKWNFTYKVQSQEGPNGEWGPWRQINTFVAVPPIEFTPTGKILYDGKPADTCCNWLNFKVNKNQVELVNPTNTPDCALSLCLKCDSWKILTLTDTLLEIEQCGVRNRYERDKN